MAINVPVGRLERSSTRLGDIAGVYSDLLGVGIVVGRLLY